MTNERSESSHTACAMTNERSESSHTACAMTNERSESSHTYLDHKLCFRYIMKCTKKSLDNGMTIAMIPLENTQIISMGFFVKAGSRNETDANNGIAHFLEHMMFKGTTTRTATHLFKELDVLGSVYNAATTAQYTYYYIYGNSNNTKKILDIILDIYINPVFETREINKEKKVIIEEMRLRADLPETKLLTSLHKKMYRNTSLERTIIGTEPSIKSLKRKDFVNFRASLYKPNNTVFVIVGNFNPVPIYKMCKNILSRLTNPAVPPVQYCDEKTVIMGNMMNQKEPYVHVKKNLNVKQAYVVLAFPMYDLYSKYRREIELLSQLLSSGFSSRLNNALRTNKGMTYNSSTYSITYSDNSLFIIQLVINPIDFVAGLKIVMNELKKVKRREISREEMTKIVNVTKNGSIYSMVAPIDVLTFYGVNLLEDRAFEYDMPQELSYVKKVTKRQIQQVAEKIFVYEKINLFVYGNVNVTNYDFIQL